MLGCSVIYLTESGAMGDLSGYTKGVVHAQAGWNESKAALDNAIQTELNGSNTLAQAQAKFHKDMSNSDAADAEQAFNSSQQALSDAPRKLTDAQKQAMEKVTAQAKQDVDAMVRNRAEERAKLKEQAVGGAAEQGAVPFDQTLPENVSNEGEEGNPLAQSNGSGIMGEGTQGDTGNGVGDAGKADGQTADGKVETYYKDEQLKTEPDKAYFWSGNSDGMGGKDFAREFANKNGGTTLEKLLDEQGIILPAWDVDNPASLQEWRFASAKYARQASGVVHALIGSKINPNGVWKTIELKELMNNPNVTKIIQIDPRTLVETIVFER